MTSITCKDTTFSKRLRIEKTFDADSDKLLKGVPEPLNATPSHCALFCGLPGCGKSTLLENLLLKKNGYRGKFHEIFYINPNIRSDCIFKKFSKGITCYDTCDEDVLSQIIANAKESQDRKIEQWEADWDAYDYYKQTGDWDEDQPKPRKPSSIKPKHYCLLVLDDCVSSFREVENKLGDILRNRRHLLKHGGLSVWIVSQVYNQFPLKLRKILTNVFCFQRPAYNADEMEVIRKEQCSFVERDKWNEICKFTFNKNHNNMMIDSINAKVYKNFQELEY